MATQILEVPLVVATGSTTATAYTPLIASRWVTMIEVLVGTFTGTSAAINITDEVTGLPLLSDSSGFSSSATVARIQLQTVGALGISGAWIALRTPSRLKIEVTDVTAAQAGTVKIHVQDTQPKVLI